jgi:hypothetical protein
MFLLIAFKMIFAATEHLKINIISYHFINWILALSVDADLRDEVLLKISFGTSWTVTLTRSHSVGRDSKL